MVRQEILKVKTNGRGMINVSTAIADIVARAQINIGICQVFIEHTSASLIVCENADPDVRRDLESFMSRLVVDGDPEFMHTAEGEDDMPSHIRSVLTQTSLTLPVTDRALGLGTWQGIYLWEHRYSGHSRCLRVTVVGE